MGKNRCLEAFKTNSSNAVLPQGYYSQFKQSLLITNGFTKQKATRKKIYRLSCIEQNGGGKRVASKFRNRNQTVYQTSQEITAASTSERCCVELPNL